MQEFEDARFGERDEFTALKESGEFPFGSVPVLYITEGGETTTIAQSPSVRAALPFGVSPPGASEAASQELLEHAAAMKEGLDAVH